jgi:hypothetical protein
VHQGEITATSGAHLRPVERGGVGQTPHPTKGGLQPVRRFRVAGGKVLETPGVGVDPSHDD